MGGRLLLFLVSRLFLVGFVGRVDSEFLAEQLELVSYHIAGLRTRQFTSVLEGNLNWIQSNPASHRTAVYVACCPSGVRNGSVRSRILVVPAVNNLDTFSRLMAHLGHYFAHLEPERIAILVESTLMEAATAWLHSPSLPKGFASSVTPRVEAVESAICLHPWPSGLDRLASRSELVLNWDIDRSELEPWVTALSGYRRNKTLFDIDWAGIRQGAGWIAEASNVLRRSRDFDRSLTSGMAPLSKVLGGAERAYLVATGPSVRAALDRDLSDGIRIVCNTVVLDNELMEHIQPQILTFADPIFHFGPSAYAQRFQSVVIEQVNKHDLMVVTTERYAPLLRAHAPEIQDRVIGLRQGNVAWPNNFDLTRQPAVRPYPNVATMLMLPLAASFSRSIAMIGFDGRLPTDDHFWTYGASVQFDEELEEIREVHPGFFELDYDDYYSTHVSTLDRMISQLEERGITVRSLTPSHMAPLRRRSTPKQPTSSQTDAGTRPLLVSVTPDWIGDFGHFGPFERRIHDVAATDQYDHISLASAGLYPDADWQMPTFSERTFPFGRGRFAPVGHRFTSELLTALAKQRLEPGSIVMFYAADVWHLPGTLDAARQFPRVRFTVNLMRSHSWIAAAMEQSEPWVDDLVALMVECLAAASETNVDITVDSQALATDIELLTGSRPPVWPMIALSSLTPQSIQSESPHKGIHIVSPVHALQSNGFSDLADLSELLRGRLERSELRLTARWPAPEATDDQMAIEQAERIQINGGHLVRGNPTDQEFANLIASADIIVVPYRLRPFRTRTSGVVVEALLAGKPAIAVRGTWAGNLIERYGAGLTYEERNIADMHRAITKLLGNLASFRKRAQEIHNAIADEHAPERLIEFLRSDLDVTDNPPAEKQVEAIRSRAERMLKLHRWLTESQDSMRIDAAVRDDDRRRHLEWRLDYIEVLGRRDAQNKEKLAQRDLRVHGHLELDEQAYSREAHAHLDEMEMIGLLVDPEGRRAGSLVDVGAHHGSAFRHLLNKGWRVHAFEPDLRHAAFLEDRYGRDERVTLDTRAVTDETGSRRTFYTSKESTGVSTLSPFLDSHEAVGEVETVALRDALDNNHVAILKIDTEGFDLPVLRGFPWEQDKPDVVLCEFEDRKTVPLGYSLDDLGSFLVDRGYQVWKSEWHPVLRYGRKHDWHRLTPYATGTSSPDAWGNLLAFKVPIEEKHMSAALTSCLSIENTKALAIPVEISSQKVGLEEDAPHSKSLSSRRDGLRGAMKGTLLQVLSLTIMIYLVAGALLLASQIGFAVAALIAGVITSTVATVIVAVRLERRRDR